MQESYRTLSTAYTVMALLVVAVAGFTASNALLAFSQSTPEPVFVGVTPSHIEGYDIEIAAISLSVYNNGTGGTIFVSAETNSTTLYYAELNVSSNTTVSVEITIEMGLLGPGNHTVTIYTGPAGGQPTDNVSIDVTVHATPTASVSAVDIYAINTPGNYTVPVNASIAGSDGNYTIILLEDDTVLASWDVTANATWIGTFNHTIAIDSPPPFDITLYWRVYLHLYNGSTYLLAEQAQHVVGALMDVILPELPLLHIGSLYNYTFQVNATLPGTIAYIPVRISYTDTSPLPVNLADGINNITIPVEAPAIPGSGNITVNITADHGYAAASIVFYSGNVSVQEISFDPPAPAIGVPFTVNMTLYVEMPYATVVLPVKLSINGSSGGILWENTFLATVSGTGNYTFSLNVPGLTATSGTYTLAIYHSTIPPVAGPDVAAGNTALHIVYPLVLSADALPGPATGQSTLYTSIELTGGAGSVFNLTITWNNTVLGGPVEVWLEPGGPVNLSLNFTLPPIPGTQSLTLGITQAGHRVVEVQFNVNVTGGTVDPGPNPFYVLVDTAFQLNVTLKNTGPLETGFSVLVYVDGVHVATWSSILEPGGETVFVLPFDGYDSPGTHNVSYIVNVEGVTVYDVTQTVYVVSITAYMQPADTAVPSEAGVAGEILYVEVESPVPVNISVRGGLNGTLYFTALPGVLHEIYLLYEAANTSGAYPVNATVGLFNGAYFVDAITASSFYYVYTLEIVSISVSPEPAVAGGIYTVSLNVSLSSPVPVSYNYTVSAGGYQTSSTVTLLPGSNLVVGVMEAPDEPGAYSGLFNLSRLMTCCNHTLNMGFTVDVASAFISYVDPPLITSYPDETWNISLGVSLESPVPMNGQILVTLGDALTASWNGTLEPGLNTIQLEFNAPQPGSYTIELKIILAGIIQDVEALNLTVIPYPVPYISSSTDHTYYMLGSNVGVTVDIQSQVSGGLFHVQVTLGDSSEWGVLDLEPGGSSSIAFTLPAPDTVGPSTVEIRVFLELFNGSNIQVYEVNLSIWTYDLEVSLFYQPIIRLGDELRIVYNVTLECPCTAGVPALIDGNLTQQTALRPGANIFEYRNSDLGSGRHIFHVTLSIDGVVVDDRSVEVTVVEGRLSAGDVFSLPGGEAVLNVSYVLSPADVEILFKVSVAGTGSSYTFAPGEPISFPAPAGLGDYTLNISMYTDGVVINYTLVTLHVVSLSIGNIDVEPYPSICDVQPTLTITVHNPTQIPLNATLETGDTNQQILVFPGDNTVVIPISLPCTAETSLPVRLYLFGELVDATTVSIRFVEARITDVLVNETANGIVLITVIVEGTLGDATFNLTVQPGWDGRNWTVFTLNEGERVEIDFAYNAPGSAGNYTVTVNLYLGSLIVDEKTVLFAYTSGITTNNTIPSGPGNVNETTDNETEETPNETVNESGQTGISIGGSNTSDTREKVMVLVLIAAGISVGGLLGYFIWKRRKTGVVVEF